MSLSCMRATERQELRVEDLSSVGPHEYSPSFKEETQWETFKEGPGRSVSESQKSSSNSVTTEPTAHISSFHYFFFPCTASAFISPISSLFQTQPCRDEHWANTAIKNKVFISKQLPDQTDLRPLGQHSAGRLFCTQRSWRFFRTIWVAVGRPNQARQAPPLTCCSH